MPQGKKNRVCGCGNTYEPKNDKDMICPTCRYFLRAKYSRNVFFTEQLRAEYNARYGLSLSYGPFVLKLEQIERRRLSFDGKREKRST